MRAIRATLVLAFLLPSTPVLAEAQEPQAAHVAAIVGAFRYDMTRTGTAPMIALRATRSAASVLTLEGGVTLARPRPVAGETTTFIAPDVQAQLTLPFSAVVPYMGLGTGAVFDLRSGDAGDSSIDFSVNGALGIRAYLRGRTGVQAEFRGRGVGVDFDRSAAEFTLGLIWRM